jgi:hypothetical protein
VSIILRRFDLYILSDFILKKCDKCVIILHSVGVTGFGTLMYGSYRVGTPVWGAVYEGFSCMKDHQNHILCIVVSFVNCNYWVR